jgi:hypothetical protein
MLDGPRVLFSSSYCLHCQQQLLQSLTLLWLRTVSLSDSLSCCLGVHALRLPHHTQSAVSLLESMGLSGPTGRIQS